MGAMAVLLVEDDTVVRLTLCECLEDAGLEVLDAGDAMTALGMLEQSLHDITILVTDLDLGPGDNGLILARKAKKRLPHLRVVYATGSPEILSGRRMRPWERIFIKPFDIYRFKGDVAALDQALRGSMAALNV
jgi:DNA-binding NtrC family response regulator